MRKILLSTAMTIVAMGSAHGQTSTTVFVDNANIGPDRTVDVIISGGKIESVGETLSMPEGATQMEGEDLWVSAGIFAPLTQLGMVEVGAESSTDDRRAREANTSVSDLAFYGFNPNSPVIDNTRVSGVTHAAVSGFPTHNIFGPTGFVANMSGDADSVENSRAFVYVQFGSRGGDLAGGSRSAAMSQLRNALSDARNYASRFGGPDDGDALRRRDAAGLQQVARGRMPLIIGADRASDILHIIDLKKELRVNVIIAGAAEAWMVAEELKDANIPVILDPIANLPRSFDYVGARIDNAKLLDEAGVEFALMSFSEDPSHNVRVLNQHAGNAVANGLSWESAMNAITSTPANWFGVNIGGVSKGSDTFVVWDGDPLQVTSAPIMVVIDGEEQSLMSRQRELRDRYNPTREEIRAHKYR